MEGIFKSGDAILDQDPDGPQDHARKNSLLGYFFPPQGGQKGGTKACLQSGAHIKLQPVNQRFSLQRQEEGYHPDNQSSHPADENQAAQR